MGIIFFYITQKDSTYILMLKGEKVSQMLQWKSIFQQFMICNQRSPT